MTSPQTIDGWNGIDFRFFSEGCVKRLAASRDRWVIHEARPKISEVVGGTIAARVHAATRVISGVYDHALKVADGSVPFRGRAVWKRIAEPEAKMLGKVFDDSRHAYYLGYANFHFGHFLLETISRAWAWRERGVECVPVLQSPTTRLPTFATVFLDLIPGISANLEIIGRTTRFSRVIVPHPAFVIAHEAFVEFKRLCETMAERAVGDFQGERTEQPLYLSRAGLHPERQRTLLGEERLERFLVQQGFLVVRPETVPVREQIALFNRHKFIVSAVGSACHTRLFARGVTTLIVLSRDGIPPNYLLCDRLCAGNSHYANVLSVPELDTRVRLPVEPLMIDCDRLLMLLRDFGLIGPNAEFCDPPPSLEDYKRRWILAAEAHSRRSGDVTLTDAVRNISSASPS